MSRTRDNVLVDADWVEAHLDDPKVVLVEVDEDTSAYDKNHIKGAVRLDWKQDLQDPVRRDFVEQGAVRGAALRAGHRQRRHRRPVRRQQQLVRGLRLLVLQALRPRRRQAARRRSQEVGARLPRARRRRPSTAPGHDVHGEGPGPLDPRVPRRGRVGHRPEEPGRRPLARRVRRPAARARAPAAGAGAAPRPHPDRRQHPVVADRERRRHLQVRRRAHDAVRGRGRRPLARTPSPTAGSASARRTPGSCCTRSSGSRTSRTTTARGPSGARWSACRSSSGDQP